jgi:very-short-patch-repair endonuclease
VYEARRARRNKSLPEALLWQRLKGSPQGIRFRKQHPIDDCRADFYCASAKLVIEIDGVSHDMGDRPARDERRTAVLEARGYAVIRIPATDVLRNTDSVAASIVAYAARPLHHDAGADVPRTSAALSGGQGDLLISDGPPPCPGEDR